MRKQIIEHGPLWPTSLFWVSANGVGRNTAAWLMGEATIANDSGQPAIPAEHHIFSLRRLVENRSPSRSRGKVNEPAMIDCLQNI